jgi:hypothetical protein
VVNVEVRLLVTHLSGEEDYIYPIYSCTSKMRHTGCTNKHTRADQLESYVMNKIKSTILTDDSIEAIAIELAAIVNDTFENSRGLRVELEKKRSIIKSQIDKILDFYLSNQIDQSMLIDKTSSLKKSLDVCEEQLMNLPVRESIKFNAEKLKESLIELRNMLDSADQSAKRFVVHTLAKKIIIDHETINIDFSVDAVQNKNPIRTQSGILSDKVGGGEGSRTPVQIVLHIQASTVYSATGDQTLVNGPTWFDLSDWIVGEFRTNDWIPYSSFLLPSPSLRTNPGRHAEV